MFSRTRDRKGRRRSNRLGGERLEERCMLAGEPFVEEILIRSRAWTQPFLDELARLGHGEAGYSVAADDEASWINIDQILVRFSEDVQVQSSGLSVRGALHPQGHDFAPAGFVYDSATHSATWTLAMPLAADHYSIQVSDQVRDLGGQVLVGLRSSRLNIVPGDVDGDARTLRADLTSNLGRQFTQIGDPRYDVAHDLNGDGVINIIDFAQVRDAQSSALPKGKPEQAASTLELAAVLGFSPVDMFQHVRNNVELQLYSGLMKGPQATFETAAGNTWDQAGLLIELLAHSGVSARYVEGVIDVEPGDLTAWVGGIDAEAAATILAQLNVQPITFTNPDGSVAFVRFGHVWVEADLPAALGAPAAVIALDPSFKFKDYRAGVPNLLTRLPYDDAFEAEFLSQVRSDLPFEYYERRVAEYLNANLPGHSVADVGFDGPIIPQTFRSLPATLPYSVNVIDNRYEPASVPASWKHTARLILRRGATTLLDRSFNVAEVSLQRITITYSPSAGQLIPQLEIDGQVTLQGPAIPAGSAVQVVLQTQAPNGVASAQISANRTAGQYIGIGLNALQMSQRSLARTVAQSNALAIDARNGAAVDRDDEVGTLLQLALLDYYFKDNQARSVLSDLTHYHVVHWRVESGFAYSDASVAYHWDLPFPAVPQGASIDLPGGIFSLFVSNSGDFSDQETVQRIEGLNGSAQEHAVWEEIINTESISTVKSLQLAGERGIPVCVINFATSINCNVSQLTHAPSTIASIQAEINAGSTVTVPRNPTPLNDWQGVGYLTRRLDGSVGYIISGGLNGEVTTTEGGFATGDPDSPPPVPPGNGENENQENVGDPVNIANGNVTRDEIDVVLPATGLPLSLARHYDSQSDADLGMGRGWVHSYSDRLMVNPQGSIGWIDDEAHRYTFEPDGSGGFVVPDALHGTFTSGLNRLTYRNKDGLTRDYDGTGRLLQIRDRNNNALALEYDSEGRLSAVVDADIPMRRLTFTWDAQHIASVTDFTGRTWTYHYDGGYLVEVIAPSDAATPAASVQYDYYTDPARNGLLRQITEPNGGTTLYAYYPDRRAFEVTDAEGYAHRFHYNLFRHQTQFVDERWNAVQYTYNDDGNLLNVIYSDRASESYVWEDALLHSWQDPFGNIESYEYDDLGNITQTTDRAGHVTQRTYEPVYANVTLIDGPGDRDTILRYDNRGNLVEVEDALGNIVAMTYETHGLLQTRTDPRGTLTPQSGDYTTAYSYNEAGQLLSRVADGASLESFSYDHRGNLLTTRDANGKTSRLSYDMIGRAVTMTDRLGRDTSVVYGANGEILSAADPLGTALTNTYDLRGKTIQTTNADGSSRRSTYDGAANLTSVTDELERTTFFDYDSRNRLIQTRYPDGAATRYAYDGGNRMTAVSDNVDNVTRFIYDATGHVIQETDADDRPTLYEYDAVGNLVRFIDRNGREIEYAHDDINRRTTETWKTNGQTTNAFSYEYDPVGNLVSVADNISTLTFAYDSKNRVATVASASTSGAPTALLTYEYDPAGNVRSVMDQVPGVSSGVTSYEYDSLHHVTQITQQASGASDKHVALNYGDRGEFMSIARYSDIAGTQLVATSTYSYDAERRLEAITHRNRTDVVAYFSYQYDAAGQLQRLVDVDGTTDYSYNAGGQLTGASDGNAATVDEAYHYDANGNRTSSHQHSVYQTGTGNRLRSDSTYRYDYDDHGNLVRRTRLAVPNDYREFAWDHRNRLVSVTDKTTAGAKTLEVKYTYDALDRRIAKAVDANPADSIDGAITYFVYDGEDAILDILDSDGAGSSAPALAQRYLHGPLVDQVLAEDAGNGVVRWHLADHLGTTRDLVDNAGIIVNHLRYDSFGGLISQTNSSATTRYRFTGREFDVETALYYYRARYYDAAVGRFISPDPIGFGGGDVNLYRYVWNQTTVRSDPSGLLDNRTICEREYANESVERWVCTQLGNIFPEYRDCLISEREITGRGDKDSPWEFLHRHIICLPELQPGISRIIFITHIVIAYL